MTHNVKIVAVEEDGYYNSKHISGNCVKVTLRKGNEYVQCGQLVLWEGEDSDIASTFEEWKDCAIAGEEGYRYWTDIRWSNEDLARLTIE